MDEALLAPGARSYAPAMRLRLARMVIAVITVCAFLIVGLVQNMPFVQADTAGMTTAGMVMMADQGEDVAPLPCHGTQKPAPCKDKVPGCMTDLGCLFVVGIPAPPTRVGEHLAWGRVTYWAMANPTKGIAPEPHLEPPIQLV